MNFHENLQPSLSSLRASRSYTLRVIFEGRSENCVARFHHEIHKRRENIEISFWSWVVILSVWVSVCFWKLFYFCCVPPVLFFDGVEFGRLCWWDVFRAAEQWLCCLLDKHKILPATQCIQNIKVRGEPCLTCCNTISSLFQKRICIVSAFANIEVMLISRSNVQCPASYVRTT